jgi:hypothetical protein
MSERMQWSEAEAVVRAYRAEHGMTDEIDVATLALALGTDVANVRRLAGRKPRFVDRSGLLSAGIAITVIAAAFAFAGPSLLKKNPLLASLMPAPAVEPPTFEIAPLPPMPATASFSMRLDGRESKVWVIERTHENM